MTNRRQAAAASLAAGLMVLVAACSGDTEGAVGDPSPTPTSPTVASSEPTSTPASESQVAARAASRLIRRYYALRDDLRTHPKVPMSRLRTVTIGSELTAQRALFARERRDGWHQTGRTDLAELAVQAVNLQRGDASSGQVPIVEIDVCYDVTGVDVLDAGGQSVIAKGRPDTGWIRYSVANYRYKADPTGSWRVASSQNLERTPCEAS